MLPKPADIERAQTQGQFQWAYMVPRSREHDKGYHHTMEGVATEAADICYPEGWELVSRRLLDFVQPFPNELEENPEEVAVCVYLFKRKAPR